MAIIFHLMISLLHLFLECPPPLLVQTVLFLFCTAISDFGYEHDEFGELCFATGSAAPVPAVCPEGKTYQHSRG